MCLLLTAYYPLLLPLPLPQEPLLFDMSVRDNVCFAVRGAAPSDEQLHAALEAAGAAELLADLPQGLDTPPGEGGRRLSGGQRQNPHPTPNPNPTPAPDPNLNPNPSQVSGSGW